MAVLVILIISTQLIYTQPIYIYTTHADEKGIHVNNNLYIKEYYRSVSVPLQSIALDWSKHWEYKNSLKYSYSFAQKLHFLQIILIKIYVQTFLQMFTCSTTYKKKNRHIQNLQ